jgi:hypothetical protein
MIGAILGLLCAAALFLSGCGSHCSLTYERNPDGGYSVTGSCNFPDHKHEELKP